MIQWSADQADKCFYNDAGFEPHSFRKDFSFEDGSSSLLEVKLLKKELTPEDLGFCFMVVSPAYSEVGGSAIMEGDILCLDSNQVAHVVYRRAPHRIGLRHRTHWGTPALTTRLRIKNLVLPMLKYRRDVKYHSVRMAHIGDNMAVIWAEAPFESHVLKLVLDELHKANPGTSFEFELFEELKTPAQKLKDLQDAEDELLAP